MSLLSCSSRGQKSKINLTGQKSRCWQAGSLGSLFSCGEDSVSLLLQLLEAISSSWTVAPSVNPSNLLLSPSHLWLSLILLSPLRKNPYHYHGLTWGTQGYISISRFLTKFLFPWKVTLHRTQGGIRTWTYLGRPLSSLPLRLQRPRILVFFCIGFK